MESRDAMPVPATESAAARESDMIDLAMPLAPRWRSLLAAPVLSTLLAYGATWLLTPEYTGSTTFLPPQQQNSGAGALSSLGVLASLAGGVTKSPAEQLVSLMQSVTSTDRVIDRFSLMNVYGAKLREDARKSLAKRSRFTIGKKDGLITVQVDDTDPARAAAIANDYVDELRGLTSRFAISEAQQRRVFFEREMKQAQDKLVTAQFALQDAGFTQGALKSEPHAAASAYASLRAQLTTAEVKLQTMLSTLSESNPMVVQQRALVQSLREQVNALESDVNANGRQQGDYVTRYRDFKYNETLFEQLARQYELARVDEAREGALIQVVDPARPPERRSFPKRVPLALGAGVLATLLYAAMLVARHRWRAALEDEEFAGRVESLRDLARRRPGRPT